MLLPSCPDVAKKKGRPKATLAGYGVPLALGQDRHAAPGGTPEGSVTENGKTDGHHRPG